jgi:phage-related minor tail protein
MASRIKGIMVEIGGDTSGLERALSDVNNSIKKTQSQLRDVNNLLKLDPSNTVLLAQKQELLQSAIGDTEQKLQALEQAQEEVTKAFERDDLGKDQYMVFQREVEETRGTRNRYKADLSGLQSEQERLSTNTERLSKLFAATESSVDDYADVLGSRLVNAIKSGTASSDQLKTAIEKIGKSATGGKADIKQLTDALDTVDDRRAIRNLIEDLNDVGDVAQDAVGDIGEIAEATKGAALMEAADQLSVVGDKIQDIGGKAVSAYTETENAVTKVNAYFGETGAAAEVSAQIVKDVYGAGVGDSMESVADAVIMVKKNLGELSDTDITNLTQQALTLDELYGIDMNETLRGVNALMKQYGMTAQEAMDYIAKGTQNGLDRFPKKEKHGFTRQGGKDKPIRKERIFCIQCFTYRLMMDAMRFSSTEGVPAMIFS